MQNKIALFVIGLFFGGGIGFLVAAGNNITLSGHEHGEHAVSEADILAAATVDHTHNHNQFVEIQNDTNAPTLEVIMHPDDVSGWNLEIVTTNFTFAPKSVNLEHIAGEGHAHVYVNDKRIARLYSPWMHIGTLPAGDTVISVSLNANDHRPISVDGTPLNAEMLIQVQ